MYVVQKTKRELGTLLKIKRTRCTVDIGGRRYSMLADSDVLQEIQWGDEKSVITLA